MNAPGSHRSSHRHVRFRGFITYLLTFSFFVMVISGVVNFLAPSGPVAIEIEWSLLGLDRIAWQSLHLSFAAVFIVVGLIHLAYNWHGLLHYLKDRASHHLTLKREAAIAVALTVALILSAVMAVPPASNLHALTVQFRQTFWVDDSAARSGATVPPTIQPAVQIPAADSDPLPRGHPPVPPNLPCSACHRGQ